MTTTMAKAKKAKTPKKKPVRAVRLRQLVRAIKRRRVRAKRPQRLTQAEYALALDRIVRAIARSRPGAIVTFSAARVL
jgi:hypothetical protein